MMKRLLNNKTGVTILEGLIALGLLALVAGGTFGVLLSVSRKASKPDIREEMILAVERANELLMRYSVPSSSTNLPDEANNGLCNNGDKTLSVGDNKNINCMLPAICDRGGSASSFSYSVEEVAFSPANFPVADTYRLTNFPTKKKVTFNIKCNGFTL